MMSADRTSPAIESSPRHDSPILSLLIALGALLYTSLFWGRFATHWPAPLDRWGDLVYPHVAPLRASNPWSWLGIQMMVGVVVPIGLFRATGRRLGEMGLGRPNRLGMRWACLAVFVAVPFGAVLRRSAPASWSPRFDGRYAVELLAMIPEHVLICGVIVAALLPGRRLVRPAVPSAADGARQRRAVRWLGFGWSRGDGSGGRLARWLGMAHWGRPGGMAVCVSAILFASVHVGKGHPLELALSVPGGAFLAYATLRTGSIWPMLLAHWALNVIPDAYVVLTR